MQLLSPAGGKSSWSMKALNLNWGKTRFSNFKTTIIYKPNVSPSNFTTIVLMSLINVSLPLLSYNCMLKDCVYYTPNAVVELLSQSAHTPAYRVCWGIQLLVPPVGNLLTLKSLTFRTSFSAFHCLPALVHLPRRGSPNQNNTTWPVTANQIDAKKMHVSATSLAPDWPVGS